MPRHIVEFECLKGMKKPPKEELLDKKLAL